MVIFKVNIQLKNLGFVFAYDVKLVTRNNYV